MGVVAGALLERELGRWRDRHPDASIHLVHPDRAMAELVGVRPMALFDAERARALYPLALEQGLRRGEEIQAAWSGGPGEPDRAA
jgi:hypothetical protein